MSTYGFFEVVRHSDTRTATIWLNNPAKKNLLGSDFWRELPLVVAELNADPQVRAAVVAARGDHFSIGLDFKMMFAELGPIFQEQTGEGREKLYHKIRQMQSGCNAMAEATGVVFVAAVHGWCIGAGLDLIAACDLRVAAANTQVSLRETKMGIVADIGSLARLPRIIGQGHTRYLAFTSTDVPAEQALAMGLFSAVHPTPEATYSAAQELAATIAANPSITLRGAKHILNHAESHSAAENMEYVAVWNSSFLDSTDFREAIAAFLEKRSPKFN
jgi:enoyl-CoA hydratase